MTEYATLTKKVTVFAINEYFCSLNCRWLSLREDKRFYCTLYMMPLAFNAEHINRTGNCLRKGVDECPF